MLLPTLSSTMQNSIGHTQRTKGAALNSFFSALFLTSVPSTPARSSTSSACQTPSAPKGSCAPCAAVPSGLVRRLERVEALRLMA
jgi:hypothetical protein